VKWLSDSTLLPRVRKPAFAVYTALVAALVVRLAVLDEWSAVRWAVLIAFVATAGTDKVASPSARSLYLGVSLFAALSWIVTYLPELWFGIAYRLNHAENYLLHANALMTKIPFNDGAFVWRHRWEPFSALMRWVYVNGFDMVVWIPVVRSLVACDARKVARYALGAHVLQFPLILPFYSAIRVDEVWSVLGDPDRCLRGWTDEMRLSIGANCFPSMHTSVAFAVWLMARGEKSRVFSTAMGVYAFSIVFSTVYMEIHWLVDVAGGFVLGYVAVRLTDRLLAWAWQPAAIAAPSESAARA
jgi:membrane-associated phospholipid phosphatase